MDRLPIGHIFKVEGTVKKTLCKKQDAEMSQ